MPYNANNYDESFAQEYGGFSDGRYSDRGYSDGRRGGRGEGSMREDRYVL